MVTNANNGNRDSSNDAGEDYVNKSPFRFRIVHLVYAVALACAYLATFGPMGLIPGVGMLIFWSIVFRQDSRPEALKIGCFALLLPVSLFLLGKLLNPSMSRPASTGMICANNLKQIYVALHNYEAVHGELPPPFIADANGKPMHSWRVLILPYLDQQALYAAYRFDEPWNGPNNRKLADIKLSSLCCPTCSQRPDHEDSHTSYLAVVGPSTAWSVSKKRNLNQLPSDSVLVVEHYAQIHWMEPRDLEMPAAPGVLATTTPITGHTPQGSISRDGYRRWVLWADGRTQFVSHGVATEDAWKGLLECDDWNRLKNTAVAASRNRLSVSAPSTPNWSLWVRLAMIVAFTLWPLPWVWRNPASEL